MLVWALQNVHWWKWTEWMIFTLFIVADWLYFLHLRSNLQVLVTSEYYLFSIFFSFICSSICLEAFKCSTFTIILDYHHQYHQIFMWKLASRRSKEVRCSRRTTILNLMGFTMILWNASWLYVSYSKISIKTPLSGSFLTIWLCYIWASMKALKEYRTMHVEL